MGLLELDAVTAARQFGTAPPSSPADATKAALEELFWLLEEYGPLWYTEEHRNRALNAIQAE